MRALAAGVVVATLLALVRPSVVVAEALPTSDSARDLQVTMTSSIAYFVDEDVTAGQVRGRVSVSSAVTVGSPPSTVCMQLQWAAAGVPLAPAVPIATATVSTVATSAQGFSTSMILADPVTLPVDVDGIAVLSRAGACAAGEPALAASTSALATAPVIDCGVAQTVSVLWCEDGAASLEACSATDPRRIVNASIATPSVRARFQFACPVTGVSEGLVTAVMSADDEAVPRGTTVTVEPVAGTSARDYDVRVHVTARLWSTFTLSVSTSALQLSDVTPRAGTVPPALAVRVEPAIAEVSSSVDKLGGSFSVSSVRYFVVFNSRRAVPPPSTSMFRISFDAADGGAPRPMINATVTGDSTSLFPTYTLSVSLVRLLAPGTITLELANGVIVNDVQSTAVVESVPYVLRYDPPVPVLTPAATRFHGTSTTLTVAFSQNVTSLRATDFTLSTDLAVLATLTSDGSRRNFVLRLALQPPVVPGSIAVSLPELAGIVNPPSTVSNRVTLQYDPPTIALATASTVVNTPSAAVRLRLSSPVSGLSSDAVTIVATGGALLLKSSMTKVDDLTYDMTVSMSSPLMVTTAQLTVAAAAPGVSPPNAAGVPLELRFEPPVPSLHSSVGSDTANDAFNVSVTFSSAVSGVTRTSLQLSSTAAIGASVTLVPVAATASTEYVFEVRLSSPIARSSLRFTVPAEIAGVSPPNVASAEALVVEYAPPTAALALTPSPFTFMSTSRNRSFDVAVSFSSAVTGLRAADFTVVWSESSLFTTALTAVSTTHFILSVSIDASRGVRRGEMTISMSESSGNVSPRNAAAQDSIIIAYEPPQPELSHAPPPLASPLPYTLLVRATFSSDVAGVGAGDLTVAADSGITVAAVTVVPLCETSLPQCSVFLFSLDVTGSTASGTVLVSIAPASGGIEPANAASNVLSLSYVLPSTTSTTTATVTVTPTVTATMTATVTPTESAPTSAGAPSASPSLAPTLSPTAPTSSPGPSGAVAASASVVASLPLGGASASASAAAIVTSALPEGPSSDSAHESSTSRRSVGTQAGVSVAVAVVVVVALLVALFVVRRRRRAEAAKKSEHPKPSAADTERVRTPVAHVDPEVASGSVGIDGSDRSSPDGDVSMLTEIVLSPGADLIRRIKEEAAAGSGGAGAGSGSGSASGGGGGGTADFTAVAVAPSQELRTPMPATPLGFGTTTVPGAIPSRNMGDSTAPGGDFSTYMPRTKLPAINGPKTGHRFSLTAFSRMISALPQLLSPFRTPERNPDEQPSSRPSRAPSGANVTVLSGVKIADSVPYFRGGIAASGQRGATFSACRAMCPSCHSTDTVTTDTSMPGVIQYIAGGVQHVIRIPAGLLVSNSHGAASAGAGAGAGAGGTAPSSRVATLDTFCLQCRWLSSSTTTWGAHVTEDGVVRTELRRTPSRARDERDDEVKSTAVSTPSRSRTPRSSPPSKSSSARGRARSPSGAMSSPPPRFAIDMDDENTPLKHSVVTSDDEDGVGIDDIGVPTGMTTSLRTEYVDSVPANFSTSGAMGSAQRAHRVIVEAFTSSAPRTVPFAGSAVDELSYTPSPLSESGLALFDSFRDGAAGSAGDGGGDSPDVLADGGARQQSGGAVHGSGAAAPQTRPVAASAARVAAQALLDQENVSSLAPNKVILPSIPRAPVVCATPVATAPRSNGDGGAAPLGSAHPPVHGGMEGVSTTSAAGASVDAVAATPMSSHAASRPLPLRSTGPRLSNSSLQHAGLRIMQG